VLRHTVDADIAELRRIRDSPRRRPFGKFLLTRAGGYPGWADASDESSLRCSNMVTGGYDWVDRIVLNAFFLIVDRHGLPGHFSLIAGRSVAPAVSRASTSTHACRRKSRAEFR
jgi:hypothetical protein